MLAEMSQAWELFWLMPGPSFDVESCLRNGAFIVMNKKNFKFVIKLQVAVFLGIDKWLLDQVFPL